MAYPTVSAPYGFKPINLIGGQPYAGSTRDFPIAYNYGTAIGYGDPVALSSGYAVLPSLPVNSTNTIVGYFVGCYYTNPTTKQRLYSQYYPGNVTAGDITAIVVDDPDVVLQVAGNSNSYVQVNNQNIIDISISEELIDIQIDEEIDESDDTLTITYKYIDSIGQQELDKSKLKNMMSSLYNEAMALE